MAAAVQVPEALTPEPSPGPDSGTRPLPSTNARHALIIEGGGLRGAFSGGVLAELALRQQGRFDTIAAASSGAPSAAFWVAGHIQDAVKIWKDRTYDRQLIARRRLLGGKPLMDIDRLVAVFEHERPLDVRAVGDAAASLFVCVTNCQTGGAEYVRATPVNIIRLLHATMALPLAYGKTVHVGDTPYIDGGVADAIPLRPALTTEAQRITVILTRPRGYRKKPSMIGQAAVRLNYRGYPAIWPTFDRRWRSYNESLEHIEGLERHGEIQVIRPPAHLPAARMTRDRDRIIATLNAGRDAARRAIAEGFFDEG